MVSTNENYKDFFKDKKITQMGLGLLGRGVGDAEFLAENGADLTITDLKTETELMPSIQRLKNLPTFKLINFHLGEHRLEDFRGRDFILKGAGVPLESTLIAEAKKNNIPIEMDASLFVKIVKSNFDPERSRGAKDRGVKIIGITGTRGKTTTTMLIYEILKLALRQGSGHQDAKVHLGGNIKDMATLPLLKIVKENDYVVMELDSWQLQGFGDSKISPNISVFTTFMEDHMNYYGSTTLTTGGSTSLDSARNKTLITSQAMKKYFEDKANIFKYQKKGDILVAGEGIEGIPKTALIANAGIVPKDWSIKIPGEHNKLNIACAILTARALKIPDEIIKEAVENFGGVSGRLELVREINGVKIYNDTTATTPTATLAGLRALAPRQSSGQNQHKNIVLILGGSDKGLDMSGLVKEIPRYCKAVILLSGTGSDKLKVESLKFKVDKVSDLDSAIERVMSVAENGDVILFSPAFASFGPPPCGFKNEYDRGEKFVKLVNKLKV